MNVFIYSESKRKKETKSSMEAYWGLSIAHKTRKMFTTVFGQTSNTTQECPWAVRVLKLMDNGKQISMRLKGQLDLVTNKYCVNGQRALKI